MQNIMSSVERSVIDLVVKYGTQEGDDAKYGTYRMEFVDEQFGVEDGRIKCITKQEYLDGTGSFLSVVSEDESGYEYDCMFRDFAKEQQEFMAQWIVLCAEAREVQRKYNDRPFAEVVKEIEESGVHICNRGADYEADGSIDISTEHIANIMIGFDDAEPQPKAVALRWCQVVIDDAIIDVELW